MIFVTCILFFFFFFIYLFFWCAIIIAMLYELCRLYCELHSCTIRGTYQVTQQQADSANVKTVLFCAVKVLATSCNVDVQQKMIHACNIHWHTIPPGPAPIRQYFFLPPFPATHTATAATINRASSTDFMMAMSGDVGRCRSMSRWTVKQERSFRTVSFPDIHPAADVWELEWEANGLVPSLSFIIMFSALPLPCGHKTRPAFRHITAPPPRFLPLTVTRCKASLA